MNKCRICGKEIGKTYSDKKLRCSSCRKSVENAIGYNERTVEYVEDELFAWKQEYKKLKEEKENLKEELEKIKYNNKLYKERIDEIQIAYMKFEKATDDKYKAFRKAYGDLDQVIMNR